MKILLTGHEGYLGSCIMEYLTAKGHSVTGFGRREDLGNITRATLDQHGIETVIHSAALMDRTNTRYILDSADEYVNVTCTRRLVEALKGTEIGLLHISTKDVYGADVYTAKDVTETADRLIPAFAVTENMPLRPCTVYAKTKLIGEFIAESHPKTNILRLSSGYTSHNDKRGNWILHFARCAKTGTAVEIKGSGKQLRDPIHGEDLASLLLALHEKNVWGHRFNVGGGMDAAHSVIEVLDMIDPNLPRNFSPGGDLGYVSDITLAQQLTGWNPACSIQAEIRKLMERIRHE